MTPSKYPTWDPWIKMTPERCAYAVQRWNEDERVRIEHIAKELGVHSTSVRQVLIRRGIDVVARVRRLKKKPRIEAFLKANPGASNDAVAAEFGVHRSYIIQLRRKVAYEKN